MEYKALANKKIIHFAYYFPPIKSIGVNRSHRLANELACFFLSYSIFTTSNRNRLQKEHLAINDSIDIVELPTFDFRTILSYFQVEKKNHFDSSFKKKYRLVWWAKLIASFPFNIFLGQGGIVYILNGYLKAKKQIRENPRQFILLSVFHPYADHLIAFLLKRKYPEVLWVADFKDLHLDPIYQNYHWGRLQRWFNKKILSKANFLTTVSEGLAQNLRMFNENVYVLSNGTNQKAVQVNMDNKKFRICYTGSMYQGKPELFLKALRELIDEGAIEKDAIVFEQAGRDASIWDEWVKKYDLDDLFFAKGVVPLEEARKMQASSNMNLLFTTSHEGYKGLMTSKIYEYLAAANPIFVVIDGPKDEIIEEALSGIEHIFIGYDKDGVSGAKTFLLDKYIAWRLGESLTIQRSSWDERYYWPKMIYGFLKKLDAEALTVS